MAFTQNAINNLLATTSLTGFLQAAQFPALTGDGTTTNGSLAFTLATVNGNVGSFTNANITVNAKGLITAASNGTSSFTPMPQTVISGTSQAAAVNNGYITNNAGLCTVTLPASASVGQLVQVSGQGAGGWKIAQNSGQSIIFNSNVTTTGVGGSLASSLTNDNITVMCTVANTTWLVIHSQGNISGV